LEDAGTYDTPSVKYGAYIWWTFIDTAGQLLNVRYLGIWSGTWQLWIDETGTWHVFNPFTLPPTPQFGNAKGQAYIELWTNKIWMTSLPGPNT
jgi:hypothetical protein